MGWFRRKPKALPREVLAVNGPAQVAAALHWAEDRIELRMLLPATMLRMQGAFAYAGGWHPFVAALGEGHAALEWYYARHRPRTLEDLYFLDGPSSGLPPWEIPWLQRRQRTAPPGEHGLGPEHGVSMFGPASPQKVRLEHERLLELQRSVARNGYDPDAHGDIAGHFLKRDGEYRFYVRGGKHRAAVLAAGGAATIPVAFKRNWPRVADRAGAADWPLVAAGAASRELALRVFDRYFEFDGTQQRDALRQRPTGDPAR